MTTEDTGNSAESHDKALQHESRRDGFNAGITIGIVGIAALAVIGFLMFGAVGLRSVLGMLAVFIIPSYLFVSTLNLDTDEKILLSFFLGLGLFPLSVWYLNRVIPSFRLSIALCFAILCIAGIAFRHYKRKAQNH